MAVSQVHIKSDTYMVCLTHALSTEKEEVMGLLIGEVDEHQVSHVSAVIVIRRSDKQPDRVEISPEQLSDASTNAERLAEKLGRPMRVLGWYHSHPHITVWPSHVDVRTQAMYQMMDSGFIGLIFSVFNEDRASKHNRVQITCFQSVNQSPEGQTPQYARIEVPLHIVPSDGLTQPCLESLTQIPTILCQEEEEAYGKCKDVDLDLITRIHNCSVYTKSLCHVTEVLIGPLLQTLENRRVNSEKRLQSLRLRETELLKKLESDT